MTTPFAYSRYLSAAVIVSIMLGALFAAPPAVRAADPRCNETAGYQVWEHSNLAGRSAIWCVNISDLSHERTNLAFWESWNDAISSFQTFNMASSRRTCFWFHAGYSGGSYGATGNVTVLYVGAFYNDKFSSVRSPDRSGC